jgi:transposase
LPKTPPAVAKFARVVPNSVAAADRVAERRRAVALARHFREAEGLSIAEIADRLGRSAATVKAYFYDPNDANKGLSRERVAKAGGREVWSHLPAAATRGEILPRRTLLCARLGCPAPPVGLGF